VEPRASAHQNQAPQEPPGHAHVVRPLDPLHMIGVLIAKDTSSTAGSIRMGAVEGEGPPLTYHFLLSCTVCTQSTQDSDRVRVRSRIAKDYNFASCICRYTISKYYVFCTKHARHAPQTSSQPHYFPARMPAFFFRIIRFPHNDGLVSSLFPLDHLSDPAVNYRSPRKAMSGFL
jgi:hypothetical protein